MKVKDIIKKGYWKDLQIEVLGAAFYSSEKGELVLTKEHTWKALQPEQKWCELFSDEETTDWDITKYDEWDDETATLYIILNTDSAEKIAIDIIERHKEWWRNQELEELRLSIESAQRDIKQHEKNIKNLKKQLKELEKS